MGRVSAAGSILVDLVAGVFALSYAVLVFAFVVKLLQGGLPEVRDWIGDTFVWYDAIILGLGVPLVVWRFQHHRPYRPSHP